MLNSCPGLEIRAGGAFDLVFDNTGPSSNPWGKISGVLLGKFQMNRRILSTYRYSQNPERLFLVPKSSSALERFYQARSILVPHILHHEL